LRRSARRADLLNAVIIVVLSTDHFSIVEKGDSSRYARMPVYGDGRGGAVSNRGPGWPWSEWHPICPKDGWEQ
jgi:hypothetical protein